MFQFSPELDGFARRIRLLISGAAIALALLACGGRRAQHVAEAPSAPPVVSTPSALPPGPAASATAVPTRAQSPPAAASPASTAQRANELIVTRDQGLYLRDTRSGKERLVVAAPPGKLVSFPAWSPDGRRFLYVLDTPFTGNTGADWGGDLFTAKADGSGQEPVLQHDRAGAEVESPSWTPDGGRVVFGYSAISYDANGQYQSETYQLRELDLTTGQVRTLIDNGVSPSICRDDSALAYVRFDPETNSRVAIVVAKPDGSGGRSIVTPRPEMQAFLYPRYSPDCRRLVFAAIDASPAAQPTTGPRGLVAHLRAALQPKTAEAHGSPWELWSMNADGTDLRRLTHLAEDEPYAVWSADGRSLLFIGARGLYQLQPDGSGLKKLGDGTPHGQLTWRQQ